MKYLRYCFHTIRNLTSGRNALLAATAAVITFSIAAPAQRRSVIIWVSGSGSATESDRGQADSEALDQATSQVNAICTGTVETVEKTGDNCISIGDGDSPSYTCLVQVKGKCVINGR